MKTKKEILEELKLIFLRNSKDGILVYNDEGNYLTMDDDHNLFDHYQDQHRQHSYNVNILTKYEMGFLIHKVDTYISKHGNKENGSIPSTKDQFIRMNQDCESVLITLDRKHTPVAFENKLNELMNINMFETEQDAIDYLESNPIELELYYEPFQGLFGAEPEAVETETLCSPYSGKLIVADPENFPGEYSEENP